MPFKEKERKELQGQSPGTFRDWGEEEEPAKETDEDRLIR